MYDVILAHNKPDAEVLIEKIKGKNPAFILVLGTTETAKIPGISVAGKNPDLVDYTPPADAELLILGQCRCISGVPVSPEGLPTPALVTRSALSLADIPTFVVSGGLKKKPYVPIMELGGSAGRDIRSGRAVDNVEEVMQRARIAGENFGSIADYLVIGESIPAGTTTALATLLSMGVDAKGRLSSSMANNPHDLKNQVVEDALKTAGLEFGSMINNPLKAIEQVGDPMIPALAGLVMGASTKVPVLMAGGTQMGAVLAVIKNMDGDLGKIAIATTKWIVSDRTSDLRGIVHEIADIPILAANLDFTNSRFEGLKRYEAGEVKEGVGAGGASIASMLKSRGRITKDVLLKEIEAGYESLVKI